MDKLMAEIQALAHGRKRTHGTGALIEKHRDSISRRDLQALVKSVRDADNAVADAATRHLEWHNSPGSVWATDTTEVTVGAGKHHVQTVRDLASRYTCTPHTGHVPSDAEVAEILEAKFRRHGAPLFLKRDNGSNENGPAVAAVLARWWVIPLNSPVAYPQYNGAVERAQNEIQEGLAKALLPETCCQAHVAAHIELVAHELNHKRRASLKGKCSCELFQAGRKHAMVNRRQRKEVAAEIMEAAADILAEIPAPSERQTAKAWRLAVENWLLTNRYVTEKTRELSPSLNQQKCS